MISWKLLPYVHVNISDLLILVKLFKINTQLILILLAIRVSYLTDSCVVQRNRPVKDGRGAFLYPLPLPVPPFLYFYVLFSFTCLVHLLTANSLVQIQFENAALLPVVALCQ